MNEGSCCVVGVDLGATKIAAGAVDRAGDLILRRAAESPSEDGERLLHALLGAVRDTISECGDRGFRVMAVGVGAAAFMKLPEGIVLDSPNIDWSNVNLKQLLTSSTGLPAFVDNDANAAALGERFAGVCRGVDDFVYLTLGTGVGGGICIGGKIYRGHRGTAAEIGHMIVDPDGPICGCGGRGCLEALASGTALEREARRAASRDPGSVLNAMHGGDLGKLTGEDVAAAAMRGDTAALDAFSTVSYYLGLGIVSLIHIFDPELVVLGGGVSASGHLLLDGVRQVVSERGIPPCLEGSSVVLSSLGLDAGVLGAAALAWEGLGESA